MRFALFLAAVVLAPSVPALAAPPEEESVHIVKPGETLNGVATRAKVSAQALAKANALKQPYVLKAGQKLAIPRKAAAKVATRDASEARATSKAAARTASRVIAERRPATGTAAPENESFHVVAPGETLGGIAARAKVPRILIAEANGLQPPFAVKLGQKLQIPRTRHHAVMAGDTGFSISMKYAVPWEQIALANSLDADAPVKVGQNLLIPTLLNPPPTGAGKLEDTPRPVATIARPAPRAARFAWPLSGAVRRGFATGSDNHDGLDITAPKGATVRAAAAGTVKFAGKEKDQFGNLVVLDHGDGWYTAYGFLSRVTVKEGASVSAGERIGLVGNTGQAKQSELHFEVRQDGKPVDPLGTLPKAP